MTRTLRFNLLAAIVVASIWTASTAKAQDTTPKADRDSATVEDVHKAAQQLADAAHAAVRKATEDPALKVAALKVAKNAIVAAQVTLAQQAETLQTILDTLAREIAVVTDKQQAKAKNP